MFDKAFSKPLAALALLSTSSIAFGQYRIPHKYLEDGESSAQIIDYGIRENRTKPSSADRSIMLIPSNETTQHLLELVNKDLLGVTCNEKNQIFLGSINEDFFQEAYEKRNVRRIGVIVSEINHGATPYRGKITLSGQGVLFIKGKTGVSEKFFSMPPFIIEYDDGQMDNSIPPSSNYYQTNGTIKGKVENLNSFYTLMQNEIASSLNLTAPQGSLVTKVDDNNPYKIVGIGVLSICALFGVGRLFTRKSNQPATASVSTNLTTQAKPDTNSNYWGGGTSNTYKWRGEQGGDAGGGGGEG